MYTYCTVHKTTSTIHTRKVTTNYVFVIFIDKNDDGCELAER